MSIEPLTAERRRQQTRDYLLQAAAQVFAERGFHGASLDEVAAAAGFTKGRSTRTSRQGRPLPGAPRRRLRQGHGRRQGDARVLRHPPRGALGDFVKMIRSEMDDVPNMGALYLEFQLYALRNPTARTRLNELERADVRAIADLLEGEWVRRGFGVQDTAERTARIIIALFRGISMMRTSDPEMADEELLEGAIALQSLGHRASQSDQLGLRRAWFSACVAMKDGPVLCNRV